MRLSFQQNTPLIRRRIKKAAQNNYFNFYSGALILLYLLLSITLLSYNSSDNTVNSTPKPPKKSSEMGSSTRNKRDVDDRYELWKRKCEGQKKKFLQDGECVSRCSEMHTRSTLNLESRQLPWLCLRCEYPCRTCYVRADSCTGCYRNHTLMVPTSTCHLIVQDPHKTHKNTHTNNQKKKKDRDQSKEHQRDHPKLDCCYLDIRKCFGKTDKRLKRCRKKLKYRSRHCLNDNFEPYWKTYRKKMGFYEKIFKEKTTRRKLKRKCFSRRPSKKHKSKKNSKKHNITNITLVAMNT